MSALRVALSCDVRGLMGMQYVAGRMRMRLCHLRACRQRGVGEPAPGCAGGPLLCLPLDGGCGQGWTRGCSVHGYSAGPGATSVRPGPEDCGGVGAPRCTHQKPVVVGGGVVGTFVGPSHKLPTHPCSRFICIADTWQTTWHLRWKGGAWGMHACMRQVRVCVEWRGRGKRKGGRLGSTDNNVCRPAQTAEADQLTHNTTSR
jgi:hypothetical protein